MRPAYPYKVSKSARGLTLTKLIHCKPGFTGLYIIFLISAQNIDYAYSLEPPRRGGSNEYPQSMFWAEIWKYQNFYLKISLLLVVKFSIYLNRHVFVMNYSIPVLWVTRKMFAQHYAHSLSVQSVKFSKGLNSDKINPIVLFSSKVN